MARKVAGPPGDDDDDVRDAAQRHRDRMAERSRAQSSAVAEIGPPPKRDELLWKSCRENLELFLVECFPHSTGLKPFSEDHKRIIRRIQQAILHGGQELNIVFRGFAKSTITENAAVWASGYGHRRFLLSIGADDSAAKLAAESIKAEYETNDILMSVFPAACHAIRSLDGAPQRAARQTIDGVRTHVTASAEELVLPTVPGFEGSGCVVRCKGITANIRGQRFKRPDGEQVRPDFVIIDDPQTDASASSPSQCAKRLSTINKTILRLGGHFESIACVCNATIIEADDVVDQMQDREANPGWRVNKAPMLKSLPDKDVLDNLWLDKYAEIRTAYDPEDDDAKHAAWRAATEFYRENQAEMDRGAVATWEHCFDATWEVSAVQHAMNAWVDTTEEAFYSEYQNEPLRDTGGLDLLTPAQITQKQHHLRRGVLPARVQVVTGQVDVHPEALYYHLWAWGDDERGYMIDNGTFPDQRRRYFSHSNLRHKLSARYPGKDAESRVRIALGELFEHLFSRDFPSEDKQPRRLGRLGVDANGEMKNAVMDAVRASPFKEFITPTFGTGVTAAMNRVSDVKGSRRKGAGEEYIPTKPKPGEPKGLLFDANYWKTKFHRRLALENGSRGALSLFQVKAADHRRVADAFCAEVPKRTENESRVVYVWQLRPGHDNHDLDCAVGSMLMAGYEGVFGGDGVRRPRKRLRLSQLQESRRRVA